MKINIDKLKKLHRIAWLIGGAWLIVGTIIFIGYPWYLADQAFLESSYNYKVEAIEFRPGHRGAPHIKTGSNWHLLNIDEMKIVPFIQVADSVVKKGGSNTITVFRKDQNGNAIPHKFE